MGHLIDGREEAYRALAERLSRFPIGAVVNETFMEILKRLYTATEASLGSKLPLKPLSFEKCGHLTGMGECELKAILEGMAAKGLVVDIPRKDSAYYILSPMVVGFFEYTFMRAGELANKDLAALFEQYFKDEGVAEEVFGASTKLFKALAHEKYIPALVHTEVLSYEKASEIIRQSGGGSLAMCACRHKATHLGKACAAPVEDICTSLGRPAQWLVRRGFAREASVDDLLRNLERSYRLGLVLLADNVIDEPAYICHCCGCCCGVLRAITEKKIMSVHPSNFIPVVDPSLCLSCGACLESCRINAISQNEPAEPAVIDAATCIGCAVCANSCPSGALSMTQRSALHTPPQNKMAQYISVALERNRLE
ncbi:MAG: 4Fe-4S binding protein [Bacillota bacterium]